MSYKEKGIQIPNLIMPKFEEKFSEIFLMSYSFSKGGVSAFIPKRERSLVYCIEPPEKVFEELFPIYCVTNYNGFDFFDKEKLKQKNKAYGLGIAETEPVLAGAVNLNKIMQLEELKDFKKEKSVSKEYTRKFLSELQSQNMILKNLSKRLEEKGIREFYENQNKGPSKKINFWLG